MLPGRRVLTGVGAVLVVLLGTFATSPLLAGKIYWGTETPITVRRDNLDGSHAEVVFQLGTGPFGVYGMDLDVDDGKIYFGFRHHGYSEPRLIQRANLDGTSIETIVEPTTVHRGGLALDRDGDKIYWTDEIYDEIRRANLDGTDVETFYTGPVFGRVKGLAIDPVDRKIYWVEHPHKIRRANLDGTEVEDLLSDCCPFGTQEPIVIHTVDRQFYFGYWELVPEFDDPLMRIARANLDGTGLEVFLAASYPNVRVPTLAIDYENDRLCGYLWSAPISDIRCWNTDGSGFVDIEHDGGGPEIAVVNEPFCTDGVIDPGEECDDGNVQLCDGCSTQCEPEVGYECGDGILSPECGEECDDGNNTNGDGCEADCTATVEIPATVGWTAALLVTLLLATSSFVLFRRS